MKNYLLLSIILLGQLCAITKAQKPTTCKKKIWISPDGKIYVNKSLPVYLKISTSPDGNAQAYTLPSETTAQYANPMYFDTEGRNTFRSPYAVDTATKKTVIPKQQIVFDVYADAIAPVTHLKLVNAPEFRRNEKSYYGKNVQLAITAFDRVSGTEATYISINHDEFKVWGKLSPSFSSEKKYELSYYSVDHVGNMEKPQKLTFYVDLTPPVTSFRISGESKGHVLSSKASIKFMARDSLSGVRCIVYSINDGPEKTYRVPIPLSALKSPHSKISYYSIDNVGNKEEAKVIATSTEKPDHNSGSSPFSFYIDKEPPSIGFTIKGEQYKGKYLYISPRSLFEINATDDKSGVNKVNYSINNSLLNKTYANPFALVGSGIQNVFYSATDNVGNVALPKAQKIFVDREIPVTRMTFKGNIFTNRDTTFISGKTLIVLKATETPSGIHSIHYNLDNGEQNSYQQPFTITTEGFHTLHYFAASNVDNAEKSKTKSFFVDTVPPVIHYHFSVKAIGEKTVRNTTYVIYPSNAMLYIAATDNASGSKQIRYRINGKPTQNLIPVKDFAPGDYLIELEALDMLGNKSAKTVRFAVEK